MNHKEKSFNTEIARLCGTNAAIVATQLWEAQANADAAFYIDGYPWVRASYKRITAYLPFDEKAEKRRYRQGRSIQQKQIRSHIQLCLYKLWL